METFLLQYGFLGIAVFLFVDDMGIPLPMSTVIFTTSATLAAQGQSIPTLLPLFFIAFLAPPMANSVLFCFGMHGGRPWLRKHGHRFYLRDKHIQRAEAFFTKYGEKTVFFAAMITSIRAVTSVIAGSLGMHPARFLVYHLGGIFFWANFIVWGGYLVGSGAWPHIKTFLQALF